ncbi:hypothetical protein FSARC_11725 [Fusarium sarcochroum]|uniref:Zn(2)-C6 fungal-type domain-containing protein n=1 Tax=Fusarium sarcochroum TaxID=1208366 RepID=A0A8H4WZP4_9HYPO|nr:hypothetical protein FSARC_11725 [Fusarium sarcochroum]
MSHATLHATACIGCRRRGRKCDRTLPTCLSCEKRGVACEGYVTKWPGVAARGKLAGKSIPVADSSVAITEASSAPTRARQRKARLPSGSTDANDNLSTGPSKEQFGDTLSSVGEDEIEKFIQHYIADLSNIFFLGNGPSDNPYFQYVLPLIDTVPSIRFAIAGAASCHIAARTSDEALEQKSLRLRVHATHLLRGMLQNPSAVSDQTILASILMLAQLDMCSGDCTEFETHLKAAAVVIRNLDYDGAANRYYFEQRLAWLDMMSSTTSNQLPNLTTEEVKTIIGRFSSNGSREWSYDVFPCPIDLFEILAEITILIKSEEEITGSGQMEPQAERLSSRLREWKCPRAITGPRKHMVEGWKLGITAYLRRLFPYTNHSADVVALPNQVLELAKLIPPATSWSYSLLWPIFQVGVTLGDEATEEKEWIRKRLKICLESVGCRHFSNALETLEVIWGHHQPYDSCLTSMYGRTIMLA